MTPSHCPHCRRRIVGRDLRPTEWAALSRLADEFPGFTYRNAYKDEGGYFQGVFYKYDVLLCNRSIAQVKHMLQVMAEAASRRKPSLPPNAPEAPGVGQALE
jgi:hypothetical protein